jgi:hypothetical protein
MILYKRKSSISKGSKVMLRNETYLILNIFFTGVVLLIIAYSGFYLPEKDNYPIVCLREKLTGEPCLSCGLSHSFSLIVQGRISEAYKWNIYGIRVFLFFISQLILRVAFSIYYLKYFNNRRQLIFIDCVGSSLLFLISFWPFLINIISGILP